MTKQERLEKMEQRFQEMIRQEKKLHEQGIQYIAGIDEVGRGPLAGPVVTACVVLPEDFHVPGVDDSKKLTEKRRLAMNQEIQNRALAIGIGTASPEEIDEMNILEATKCAMVRAFHDANEKLGRKIPGAEIQHLLIDALELPGISVPQEGIVHGDASSVSIAAASIVAKVTRDAYMVEMGEKYPGYAFESNKGYGTAAHYDGIRAQGITPIHRKSFLKNLESRHGGKAVENTEAKKMTGKKVYAVRAGRETGIFQTWKECQRLVTGYPGAEYKSFTTWEAAEEYLGKKQDVQTIPETAAEIYVDGSFDVRTKRFGCGVVILYRGKEITLKHGYDDPASAELRNVAGEVMGAVNAIRYCQEHDIDEVYIYHDYNGIGKWGDDEWKANLPLTRKYKQFVADARKNMKIVFIKVEAHTGVKYNEMADRLAKDAIGLF